MRRASGSIGPLALLSVAALVGGVWYLFSSTGGSTSSSSAPTGSPSGGGQYKITINGQTQANAGNGVSCGESHAMHRFSIGAADSTGFKNSVEITNETPPKVLYVAIHSDAGDHYVFGATNYRGGDAQVNKSDKTYKITGHIASNYGKGPLVPFEFDATCP